MILCLLNPTWEMMALKGTPLEDRNLLPDVQLAAENAGRVSAEEIPPVNRNGAEEIINAPQLSEKEHDGIRKALELLNKVDSLDKLDKAKEIFKKNNDIMNTLKFYEMLRKLEELRTERIGEFRKNVNLKIFYMGGETDVDLKKLKDYALLLEKFIGRVKQYIAS